MIAAWLFAIRNCGVLVYNLGTGCGYSVLDLVHAFEQTSGVTIPYVIESRCPGDDRDKLIGRHVFENCL